MRELAKIKREREEERKKQESLAAEEQKEQEKEAALQGPWQELIWAESVCSLSMHPTLFS